MRADVSPSTPARCLTLSICLTLVGSFAPDWRFSAMRQVRHLSRMSHPVLYAGHANAILQGRWRLGRGVGSGRLAECASASWRRSRRAGWQVSIEIVSLSTSERYAGAAAPPARARHQLPRTTPSCLGPNPAVATHTGGISRASEAQCFKRHQEPIRGRVNADRNLPRSAEVKSPTSAGQGIELA